MNWNTLQVLQLEIFCFRAITTVKNLLEQCDQIPSPPRSHPLVPLRRWGYESTPLAPVYTLNGSFSYCAVFLRPCIEVPTPLSILSSLKSLSGYFSSFLLLSFLSISLSPSLSFKQEGVNSWISEVDFTEHKISQGGYRGGVLFPQNHHTLKHKPDHVSPLL